MPPLSPWRLGPADLDRFEGLRMAAVMEAAAACEAHAPQVFARFGAAGRAACIEDLGYHLEFLRSTLETGEIEPFLAYLDWLDEVLASRGVPRDSVPVSLRAMASFFERQLGGEVGEGIAAALDAGAHAMEQGTRKAKAKAEADDPAAWNEAEPYMHAALQGDRRRVQTAFDAALSRSPNQLLPELHVMQPALYAIGRAWQRNEVSVAQEHLATAITLTLMAQAATLAVYPPENGRRVLLACAPGNQHAVGLQMVGDAFELQGWQTQVLGANVPAAALAAQVAAFRPHVVALSASLPQQLKALRQGVQQLRGQLGADTPLIGVGGQVFNRFPALAGSVDALFLGRDAGQAPRIAEAALAAR